MKALIFNSGLGSRMGPLTENRPKSMVPISETETIFARQVRLLYECGIRQIVVTTGAHAPVLREEAERLSYPGLRIELVHNPRFAETNYIYSFYLAAEQADDDMLILHGDLVFRKALLEAMLADPREDIAPVNKDLPQPEKDFKARVEGETITEVSVKIMDENCYAFQPLYKLSGRTVRKWLDEIGDFVRRGDTSVYAEEALNRLLAEGQITLRAFLSNGMLINEVDTADDLREMSKAAREADGRTQEVYFGEGLYGPLMDIVRRTGIARPLVITKSTGKRCGFLKELELRGVRAALFDGFQSNPRLEDAEQGLRIFEEHGCDSLISLGGGSAMDTAKCVKALAGGEENKEAWDLVHIAIPSTAGSGAEATHFAVAYRNGEKLSIDDERLRPQAAILDPALLETLPLYQKRSTFADALCHCIESLWSVNATDSSRAFASRALRMLTDRADYFKSGTTGAEQVLLAAHLAGKAIDISQTTAAHAMSYKLTSGLKAPHGHAALLCLWAIVEHWDRIRPDDGSDELRKAERLIGESMGAADMKQVAEKLRAIAEQLGMLYGPDAERMDIDELADSVNPQRLRNFPLALSRETIKQLYAFLLRER